MDVPEATTVLLHMATRDWTYRTEYQVPKRTLRHETAHDVPCRVLPWRILHEYRNANGRAWKRDCFRSGLDFLLAPEPHHDTPSTWTPSWHLIAALPGIAPAELRDNLKLAQLGGMAEHSAVPPAWNLAEHPQVSFEAFLSQGRPDRSQQGAREPRKGPKRGRHSGLP